MLQHLLTNPLLYVALGLLLALYWALKAKSKTTLEKDELLQQNHQQAQQLTQLQADNAHMTQQLEEHNKKNKQQQDNLDALTKDFTMVHGDAEKYKGEVNTLKKQLEEKTNTNTDQLAEILTLRSKVATLETSMKEKEEHYKKLEQNANEAKAQLGETFKNLAQEILDEKKKSFEQDNKTSLETLLNPFKLKLDDFKKSVEDAKTKQTADNASLSEQIKQMMSLGQTMNQEATNLTNALKGNKKILGNWGELQLEQSLQMAGLEKNVHYEAQKQFENDDGKKQYPDFVVNMPDKKHLVIDSKMSLVAYEQAVNADTPEKNQLFLNQHCKDIRKHIDGLSEKDYSALRDLDSPNFVLMFIALEPAYLEALKQDPALFEYGYQKNVLLVSHTTLMPILRTVSNLWRLEQRNKASQEITTLAENLYYQFCTLTVRLQKLGKSLSKTQDDFNETVTSLAGRQGLLRKVERLECFSKDEKKKIIELEPISINDEKLALLNLEEKSE